MSSLYLGDVRNYTPSVWILQVAFCWYTTDKADNDLYIVTIRTYYILDTAENQQYAEFTNPAWDGICKYCDTCDYHNGQKHFKLIEKNTITSSK
jgi:hypothetical protein